MKTNEITAVPSLRFPEFKDDGGWKQTKLINLVDKDVKWSFIGGPFGSNLKASDYTDSGVRVIQLQNIGDGEFVQKSKIYTSKEKADELLANNIYPNDIIMSKMGDPVGRACIIPDTQKRYVMCSDGIRLVINENKYSKYFVFSLINSDSFRNLIERKSTGSTRKRIGLNHLKSLPIVIPTLPEQQKIADCLSSLDTLIKAETEQLDGLKAHKAGLLQQLFPAEGETVPKQRFAEFKSDGDWEEISLEKLATFRRGSFPQPYGLDKWYDDVNGEPFVQVYDVDNNLKLKPTTKRRISKQATEQSVFIPKGTLIVTLQGSIGRVAITQYDAYIDRTLLIFQKFLTPVNKVFIAYVLQMLFYIEKQKAPGGIIKTITKKALSDFLIFLPKIKEQQKIADCLASLDNLIQSKSEKVDALKTHKQGLMQQLFPQMENLV